MTLSSNAHIKLDDDEFQLAESPEGGHYSHTFRDLQPDTLDISGSPGKRNLREDSLFWTYDDWAGGEGNSIYYPDDFDMYDIAFEVNPRVRGRLTGRPNRGEETVVSREISHRSLMTVGDRAVWVGGAQNLAYSTGSPATWTDKTTTGPDEVGLRGLHANYKMTALAGDNDHVYYSGWHSGTSGSRTTWRASRTADSDTIVESEATSKAPYAGLCHMNGKLYAWTGRKLYEMDIDQSLPLAGDKIRKVYDTRVDPTSSNVFSTDWWAEAQSTENSVIMWYSNDGHSEVYEYKKGVGRPIWRPPYGFTLKGSIYSQGIMYFSGHWGGDSSQQGWGALYALPLNSYTPIFLKWIRKNTANIQAQEMCASYGMQVMVTAQKRGEVYIYDAETDGLTLLDRLYRATGSDPDGMEFIQDEGGLFNRIGGMITFGKHRYASVYTPGSSGVGTYQVIYWEDDELAQRETGLSSADWTQVTPYFDTPSWDFDYPYEIKNLIGFHVAFEPLLTNQKIVVSYSLDGAAYVALADITSATTGSATGRVYQQVSVSGSQKRFTNLRFRAQLTSTSSAKSPILFSVAAEAKLVRKREEWTLILKMKDEPTQNRTTKRRVDGSKLRDWIEETVEAGAVVNLLDGYRYKGTHPGRYTTHSVYIREAEDVVITAGEGACKVTLVAVDN